MRIACFHPLSAALIAAASLSLSGCQQPAQLYVDQAWVRASTSPQSPSAGYFVVHGGDAAVTLRGVTTDYAVRVEMHESMMDKGMMTMRPIDNVDVPARGTVAFAPGGRHLMIFGLNSAAVSAGKLPLTFLFSNGDRIEVDARVQAAGAPAPAAHTDEDHGTAHDGH